MTVSFRKRNDKVLPDNIYVTLEHFSGSSVIKEILGEQNTEKYGELRRRLRIGVLGN